MCLGYCWEDRIPYYEDPAWLEEVDHDHVLTLFYDVGYNQFIESFSGEDVMNIHRLLTPSQVFLFKTKKETMAFPSVSGLFLVELVYPEDYYLRRSEKVGE